MSDPNTNRRRVLAAAVVVFVAGLTAAVSQSPDRPRPTASDDGGITAQAGGGAVAFTDNRIPRPPGLNKDASAAMVARAVLRDHGRRFGLRDQARQLRVRETIRAHDGGTGVRFEQVHQGVPVLAGELIVHLDEGESTEAINGEVGPDPQVDVEPAVRAATAEQTARQQMAKAHDVPVGATTVLPAKLVIYDPALLGGAGVGPPRLVWQTEVSSDADEPFRETVLVDAERGSVALHFDELAEARTRYVCDKANARTTNDACTSSYARTEGGAATGKADVDKAYEYAGDTYDFFARLGRDSLDGAGMALRSSVRYCPPSTSAQPCPYPNAYWNGAQMVYGAGFATDDVVGHELAHGVTDFEAGLFYYYQSGAINESLSDVFGELIDLSNSSGNDAASVQWKLGEEIPGGPIRDMANPPTFGDPDRMTSPNYAATAADNGGVHTNSGVNNKAAWLLAEGGTFNGRTVTAIGTSKVARLYYTVATEYLTSGSDYQDLYEAMQLACQTLVGSHDFTTADCTQVRRATDATEMSLQPTAAAGRAVEAPTCASGQVPVDQFHDDLERPSSGQWTRTSHIGTTAWTYPDASYSTSGRYDMWGRDAAARGLFSIRTAQSVSIVPDRTTYLRFNHAYSLESTFDGGVVEYSLDGSEQWTDARSLFTHNGYSGTISTAKDNPLKGRSAFTGLSHGYYSSRLDLSSLAGHHVRFRFVIGTDATGSGDGWWVDDVRVYSCATRKTRPDFDGDSYADVAMGIPGEDISNKGDAGAVQILYGAAAGITGQRRQAWHEDSSGIVGASEAGDRFGASLTAGDFDGDGYDDLAVGTPGEDLGKVVDAGAVDVLYGGRAGLTSERNEEWHENSASVQGTAETGDGFGSTLAAGNLNADGADDLAVGSPAEDGTVADAGQVLLLYGRLVSGIEPAGNHVMSQGSGAGDKAEKGDKFGTALVAGDFDGNGPEDLAVGTPLEDVGAVVDAGVVHVGLGKPDTRVGAATIGLKDGVGGETVEKGDRFGASLAVGYFDLGASGFDRRADLAIGVPFEDRDAPDSGAVAVMPGGPAGPTAGGAALITQTSLGVDRSGERSDQFGTALAAGPMAGEGAWSLVAGTPLEDAGSVANAGAVVVIRVAQNLLPTAGARQWLEDEAEDRLGTSLSVGDFDHDGDADIAAGVPKEDVGSAADAGMVRFYAGSPNGVNVASTPTWAEPGPEKGDAFGAAAISGVG